LEPALALLLRQNTHDCTTWHTRYGVLLWLSILVLIPFDLTSIDSTLTLSSNSNSNHKNTITSTTSTSTSITSTTLEINKSKSNHHEIKINTTETEIDNKTEIKQVQQCQDQDQDKDQGNDLRVVCNGLGLIDTLIKVGQIYLGDTGRSREMAAGMYAELILIDIV